MSHRKNFRIISFFVFFLFFFSVINCFSESVKEPNVSGSFYPSDEGQLRAVLQKFSDEAGVHPASGIPLVLISPHAGYQYSGPVAAYGFRALEAKAFDTVVILAPSHFFPYHGASVYAQGAFRTPLGDIKVDEKLSAELIDKEPDLLFFDKEVFKQEHSIEVELPFLQNSLKPGFKILPVLIGNVSFDECKKIAEYLTQIIGNKNILVLASTDLSHYKAYDETLEYDKKTVDFIKNLDAKGLWDAVSATGWNVCGIRPVTVSLLYAKMRAGKEADILKYANSGDTAGDKTRVVGYVSALILKKVINENGEKSMIAKDEKKRLLNIARETIEAVASGKKAPIFSEKALGLNLKRGLFVTLRKNQELRGCIGLFSSDEPLYVAVSKMAIEAAMHDYRFAPVKADELSNITIEISILTEPKLIDDWRNIKLGIDGVIVKKGFSSGVFLPQVATETGWDLDTFLGELCSQKAGLARDAYRDKDVKLYTFQAEIFSEEEK